MELVNATATFNHDAGQTAEQLALFVCVFIDALRKRGITREDSIILAAAMLSGAGGITQG